MKTVLIAEAHAATRELLREDLSQAGYRVIATDDAARALECCIAEHPDAVVVGVDLPRYQGATLGKLIRASPLGAQLPIVAVDKAHLGKAKGVGAILDLMVNAYLPDATRCEELRGRLTQLIAAADTAPRPASGVTACLARPPVVSAELRSRTLPGNVHGFYRLGRSGVLVLVHRDLTRRVYFAKGRPVNYDSTARQDSLESFLLNRGTLAGDTHEELIALMGKDKLSAGAALVALGVVEAGEPLLALLRDFARTKIAQSYAMSSGRYSFYAGEEWTSEVPALELPALGPIYEAVRLSWPVRAFAATLAPLWKRYPARSPEFAKNLPALGLATLDLKVALAVSGRQTLREQLSTLRDLKHGLALFWYLATVGALSFTAEPAETAPTAGFELEGRVAAASRRRKPLPEEKAKELREDAIRILTASYFRVLGLDITADGEAVERAYHEAATRFHPDSYSEFDLGPIEELLSSVQEKLSAAYRVLSEEEKRKAYVTYLLSRSEARVSAPSVDAEIELKRGEKLMKKGDLIGALTVFERAIGLNPREPEYYSYLAWAAYKAGKGDGPQRARLASKFIKKALSMNPTLERPQVIAAIIEDEVGDPAEARRMLVKLLKASPSCELAKRTLQGLNRRHGARERG